MQNKNACKYEIISIQNKKKYVNIRLSALKKVNKYQIFSIQNKKLCKYQIISMQNKKLSKYLIISMQNKNECKYQKLNIHIFYISLKNKNRLSLLLHFNKNITLFWKGKKNKMSEIGDITLHFYIPLEILFYS